MILEAGVDGRLSGVGSRAWGGPGVGLGPVVGVGREVGREVGLGWAGRPIPIRAKIGPWTSGADGRRTPS